MSGLVQFFRRLLGPSQSSRKLAPGAFASIDLSRFAEGDRVIIDNQRLSGPLQRNQKIDTPHGYLANNDIIGRPAIRSRVKTNTGNAFEIRYPTLDEYISRTPRKVTPVYASYAALIVSLLDIHVVPPPTSDDGPTKPQLEILESGTGHGSLTLHLARAIAAANPPSPPLSFQNTPESHDLLASWRQTRRAVIHTVEVSPIFQRVAEKTVRGFRQGLYWPHIDFYTSSVADWVKEQKESRSEEENPKGFLDHVILDMPGVHNQIPGVVDTMKEDALLVVFVPSVTQIGECVKIIEKNDLRLTMEKVVELGEGISNGRIWDVRLVKPRKSGPGDKVGKAEETAEEGLQIVKDENHLDPEENLMEESVFVCRPMVGRMTFGGGFIGLWRKSEVPSLLTNRRRGKLKKNQGAPVASRTA